MEKCLFINPDNINLSKSLLKTSLAVIARPDYFMKSTKVTHLIIETDDGKVHTRCYLAKYNEVNFIIVYGRFDRIRTLSSGINFEHTQQVLSFIGINTIIGTFSVGSVCKNETSGMVYVPHDFVGMGGFNMTLNRQTGFRNVDMFNPFCNHLRSCIIHNAKIKITPKGVYVSLHGYPRIETQSELEIYERSGWNIVGQTLDPEATLARESGCHYAAIAATIDDHMLRKKFLENDPSARNEIDKNIIQGRKKTFELFLSSLPSISKLNFLHCNCYQQKKHVKQMSKFYYRPEYLQEKTTR